MAVLRRFVIVYGDKGLGVHNAGSLFEWAAKTHKLEVMLGAFPGVPPSRGASIEVFHVSSVPDLVQDISAGNLAYLAYFGHSWDSWLFIGETASRGSNLSSIRSETEAPVTDIPKEKFLPNAQIRLFGCRAGHGPAPIASNLHAYLEVTVYGYAPPGVHYSRRTRRLATVSERSHNRTLTKITLELAPIHGLYRLTEPQDSGGFR